MTIYIASRGSGTKSPALLIVRTIDMSKRSLIPKPEKQSIIVMSRLATTPDMEMPNAHEKAQNNEMHARTGAAVVGLFARLSPVPCDHYRYPTKCMSEWLYTIRERLTAQQQPFDDYRAFSGFHHIKELVTLDSMMCPDLVDELRTADWDHNVQEDFRTSLFRNADYLLTRQPLDAQKHQLIAGFESPPAQLDAPIGFAICGHDIMDSYFGNSTLTNCGPIPEVFQPTEVNSFGLIDDRDRAFAIRDTMRALQPDDPHLGNCEVWLLARRIPDVG